MLGISIGLLVGPLFFTMIHSGMHLGSKRALLFALGTWLSDLALLCLAFFLIGWITLPKSADELNPWVLVFSGSALILIGVLLFFKKTGDRAEHVRINAIHAVNLVTKGFVINTANPAAFFIWIGLAALIKNVNTENSPWMYLQFYLGVVSMIVLLDIAKICASSYLHARLKHGMWTKLNWVSGSAFVISGMWLLAKIWN